MSSQKWSLSLLIYPEAGCSNCGSWVSRISIREFTTDADRPHPRSTELNSVFQEHSQSTSVHIGVWNEWSKNWKLTTSGWHGVLFLYYLPHYLQHQELATHPWWTLTNVCRINREVKITYVMRTVSSSLPCDHVYTVLKCTQNCKFLRGTDVALSTSESTVCLPLSRAGITQCFTNCNF